jgi:hypothetical protein
MVQSVYFQDVGPEIRGSNYSTSNWFAFLQNTQAASGADLTSHSIGIEGFFPRGKATEAREKKLNSLVPG